MLFTESYVDLETPTGTMRCFLCVPNQVRKKKLCALTYFAEQQPKMHRIIAAHFLLLSFSSVIFLFLILSPLSSFSLVHILVLCLFRNLPSYGPLQRLCRLLASHGYISICPEVYHELMTGPGIALEYNDEGTNRGNECKN